MFKKALFLSLVLVLFGAFSLLIAAEEPNDASAQLEQAQTYVKNQYFEQAETIYKSIIQNYSATDDALEAQRRLTQLYIFWENEPEAEAAFETVLAEFSLEESTPEAVVQVADIYCRLGKHHEALELFQYFLDNWPENEQAIFAYDGLARSSIALGNDSDAQVAIEKLLAEFSDNDYIQTIVGEIADSYQKSGRYEEAAHFYQYALTNWPDSDELMWLQVGLASSNIGLADDLNADAAIEKLLTEFSDNNGISDAIYAIADKYLSLEKYEKAKQFFQYVLDNQPRAEEAMWSQVGLARCYIALGDEPNARAVIDKLLTEFSDNNDISEVIYDTIYEYLSLEKYEKAKQFFQYVMDNQPRAEEVMYSQVGLARCYIAVGDDPNAQVSIDYLLTDFNDYPELSDAISNIEEQYYKRILAAEPPLSEDYLNAVIVWEKVIERFPDFFHNDPDLYYFIADCYRHLGEYENAIEYYGIVSAKWTQNGYAVLSNAVVPRAEDDAAGDYEALHDTIDRLIADFGDHPGLAGVVTRSGHGYRRRANDARREGLNTEAADDNFKAIGLYGRVINEFGSSPFVASSYFFSALCYRDLGQWHDGLDCCNHLLDNWPEYKYATWAQRLAQECFDGLTAPLQ